MSESQGSHEETSEVSHLVLRAPEILMELPLALRWEFTRRHPYYLRFWELAHRYYAAPSSDPAQAEAELIAMMLLQAIGITADPPPPAADWNSLEGGQLSGAWDQGAIAPVTFRSLIGMLLAGLPLELRDQVAKRLLPAGAPSADALSQKAA